MAKRKPINNTLYLSTFPPRECGIASFTRDLAEEMHRRFHPVIKPKVVAINSDHTDIYNYDDNVTHQITASDIDDYIMIARKINADDEVKLVHVQHEFGLFGGEWGNHLIPFFQVIEKPVIVTFHTVLPNPKRDVEHTVRFILEHARAVVVMNALSKNTLVEEYGATPDQISVIPHGIPQVSFSDGRREKQKLGLEGKTVLSTFGLLSRGKGVEYAIRALPQIVKRFPNTIYLVIGATHPIVRQHEGESYRNFLNREVTRLGLSEHVKFYNRYLPLAELLTYLAATDIYVSPSLAREQSVSGTLSYALGCGRAVISTNSVYAQSIVTPECGILIEPRSDAPLTEALSQLLQHPKLVKQMGRNAYAETRHMTWSNVALAHLNLYRQHAQFERERKRPALTLRHLETLTDSFGVIQFAKNIKPDVRFGYALDDNARALIVASMARRYIKDDKPLELLRTYLAFIGFVQQRNGRLASTVTSKRIVKDEADSEDAQGRAIWALGFITAQDDLPADIKDKARAMFRRTVAQVDRFRSARAIAFSLIGLYFYNKAHPTVPYRNTLKRLADLQLRHFSKTSCKDWVWFEDFLTYSNSKLPESLFYAYLATRKKAYLAAAEQSLRFLMGITFGKEYFSAIGQNGWYFKEGKRAYFDQQPEDASSMVETLRVAYQVTKKPIYKRRAQHAFQWFLGKNHLRQLVYDEMTGGCYDGLGQYSMNLNQGAESTISYLLARLAIEEIA